MVHNRPKNPYLKEKEKGQWVFYLVVIIIVVVTYFKVNTSSAEQQKGTEDSQVAEVEATPNIPKKRVGIQPGHWKVEELPDELWKLRMGGQGGSIDGVNEWELDLEISEKLKTELEKEDIIVDLMPATVEEDYIADAFISIHADGNDYSYVEGFKVAGSAFDQTEESEKLSCSLFEGYKDLGFEVDPNVTDDMTEYYAFNSVKYHTSISNQTPAVVFEMGYLSNQHDRYLMLNKQEEIVTALKNGIINYLNKKECSQSQQEIIPSPTE